MLEPPAREVTVLAAGGTIAMAGTADQGAVPQLDAEGLVRAVPTLTDVPGLRARTISNRPSVQLTAGEALDIARAAAAEADGGRGVVVTHGTDTLEEVALLCDLLYAGDAPIVFTGAMRPASALGADGPANLYDAVIVAGAPGAEGLGVLVSFAGAVHAARAVRKFDSTAPDAFASPRLGPIGRVQEGRAWMARRLERFPPVPVAALDATVHIVPAALGADGSLVEAAVEAGADGLVGVVLGAGHTPPPYLAALRQAAARVPVVVTVRPERGSILRGTYAFEGAERDLRGGPLVCAAALTPAAARVKLMACLGAGYARGAIAQAFVADDF
ncbi:MAG TPA: asparaginase domain-containing protein [Solirubrobacteraceae bacterium]|nr:asparaginase domain-containing protein [Solirubrobacteraceae bacterium]